MSPLKTRVTFGPLPNFFGPPFALGGVNATLPQTTLRLALDSRLGMAAVFGGRVSRCQGRWGSVVRKGESLSLEAVPELCHSSRESFDRKINCKKGSWTGASKATLILGMWLWVKTNGTIVG